MNHRNTIAAAAPAIAVCLIGSATAAAAPAIPARPEQITFAPFDFQPPEAAKFRHELPGGIPVYLAPSHEFPLINLSFTFKGGAYLDSPDKVGLASATGAMIRRGGTMTVKPQELDEQLDFLAANVSSGSGPMQSSASLNCLASNFNEAFALFIDMLRNPGYDESRLKVYKAEVIERLKQRNDDARPIQSREWDRLLYGADHFEGRQPTKAMIDAMTGSDLRAMHQQIFNPGNLIIAVSGDFEPDSMLASLQRALAGWTASQRLTDPPAPTARLAPAVYHVEKDIPQGKVIIGMRSIKRDDPDYFPAIVMNEILGGGGFTSRITSRVRSDEGLAYHAVSSMAAGVYYPGEFLATFDSNNPTVALAVKIIFEEIGRIRSEPVTDEELQLAKNSFIETFPRTFESKPAMLGLFVSDEMTRREKDYWKTFRDRIRAVTKADVQRVAGRILVPENMAILVVGKWSEIAPGDLAGRAKMADFFGGAVTHLPRRDPLTLEPMPAE